MEKPFSSYSLEVLWNQEQREAFDCFLEGMEKEGWGKEVSHSGISLGMWMHERLGEGGKKEAASSWIFWGMSFVAGFLGYIQESGHTCFPEVIFKKKYENVRELLSSYVSLPEYEEYLSFLKEHDLCGVGEEKFLTIDHHFISSGKLFLCEKEIWEKSLGRPVKETQIKDKIYEIVSGKVFSDNIDIPLLNEEQLCAVKAFMDSSLTVITGGPGTGKTFTVLALLRSLVLQFGISCLSRVALVAPTGKAAGRMMESMKNAVALFQNHFFYTNVIEGMKHTLKECDDALLEKIVPQTVHRLLGYIPSFDKFSYSERNTMDYRIIIIDETSMVDIFLFHSLMKSVAHDARIVCLGDPFQLPSVDCGAIFRDLVNHPQIKVVHLLQSYRMQGEKPGGKSIYQCSRCILEGNEENFKKEWDKVSFEKSFDSFLFKGFEVWIQNEKSLDLKLFLSFWFEKFLQPLSSCAQRVWQEDEVHGKSEELKNVLLMCEKVKILTPVKEGLWGTKALNAMLRGFLEKKGWKKEGLIEGMPVMVTVNDYARNLFNGETGVLLKIKQKEEIHLMGVFWKEQRFFCYPVEWLRGMIEPAFAITVHKSQGSEYEHILVMVPSYAHQTRELFYTAVTRAKKSVLCIGEEISIEKAIKHSMKRYSRQGI